MLRRRNSAIPLSYAIFHPCHEDLPAMRSVLHPLTRLKAVQRPQFVPLVLSPVARLLLLTTTFVLLSHGLRVLLTTDLQADDAEIAVAAQSFHGGYADQPPLYTWLVRCVFFATGPSLTGLAILRAGLLLALVGITYATARLLIPDPRLANVAALSSLLMPSYAWHVVTYLTHSLLLSVAVMATVYVVARLFRDGRNRDYVALGVVVAVGVLAKYNFALVVGAMAMAGLLVPAARVRLLDARMLLALAIAGVLLLPHAVWLLGWSAEVVAQVRLKSNVGEHPPFWVGVGRGLYAGAFTLAVTLSLVAIVLAYMGRGVPSQNRLQPAGAWLGVFLLALLALHIALVIGFGVIRFADRWVQPLLLPVPIWYFMRFAPGAIPAIRVKVVMGVISALAFTILAAQAGQVVYVDRLPGGYPLRLEYAALASELKHAGYGNATFVSWDRELLGNMRIHMSNTPVFYPSGVNTIPRNAGRRVVIWDEARWGSVPPWQRVPVFDDGHLPSPPDSAAVRRFTLAPRSPCTRAISFLAYELPAE